MFKLIQFFLVLVYCVGCIMVSPLQAAEAGGVSKPWVVLEHPPFNASDKASVERGAHYFMTACAMCHNMKQLKFDDVTRKAREALVGNDDREWFDQPVLGNAPDLSLITRSRSANWVYTYLKSYYLKEDGTYDNLVVSNSMPNPFLLADINKTYDYKLSKDFKKGYEANFVSNALRPIESEYHLNAKEFDDYIYDLVNYLNYAGEPTQADRLSMAPYILIYVAILSVICYLLYREYWRKIK